MAAVCTIAGRLREVWSESVPLDGGTSRDILTTISARAVSLPRLSAQLYITPVVGTPQISATATISNGVVLVTVSNGAAPGNSATYVLDITRLFSTQQAPGGVTGIVHVIGGVRGWQGNQGWQGVQGPQGNQGHQGNQGNQGSQGNQGWQGPQGPQGWQGWQGSQGWQGWQGSQGWQGNQGNQGWQGPVGVLPATDVNGSSHIVAASDVVLLVRRTTTGTCAITLPSIASVTPVNRIIIVKDSGYNANNYNITVNPDGSDKINNVAGAYTIDIAGACFWLQANSLSNNWELI